MASIYKPKDMINWYISFIDPATGKTRNISTKLKATKENMKKADEFLKKIEEYTESKKRDYKGLPLRKKTIKEAFSHFKDINFDKHIKTLKGYDTFYDRFTKEFEVNQPVTIINKSSSEAWLIGIKKLKKAKNTQYNYYKVFNKFLRFLFEYEYLPIFMLNKDIKPKPERTEIIVFTKADNKKILETLDTKEKNSNFKTMIYLLNYTGLRPSDIVNLTVESIDLENLELSYYSQKTDQYFTVPFREKLKPILKERMNEVKSGKILNYASEKEMGKAFRRYLKDIELTGKGYNLRTFRKTFATRAFEKDIAIVSTAALLGHSNMSTTMKYYTKANRKKLADELKKLDNE